MVALAVVLCVFMAFALGYFFYARFVGEKIYDDRDDIVTPAHEFEDGRDFVPTNKHILFGHHFTSIAGAAPILGPCVAAYWGVLPALVWVVLGTIFIGAVHDFGALVISIREGGRSIADIAGSVITPRVRVMFLSFVLVLTWLVIAVFALVIAGLFVAVPSAVMPVNLEILVALGVGWLIYKKRVGALLPSLVALALLYVFVYYGPSMKVDFKLDPGAEGTILGLGWSAATAKNFWIIFLFGYAAIASLLPVWLLLQPRDYINSHQLIVGLTLLFAGIIVLNPTIDAPWIRTDAPLFAVGGKGAPPPVVPFLFVTIACGAISGFHSLVSSGTTSKQISSLKHARMIGYGSMLGEGSLALASLLAAVAGVALVGTCDIPGLGPIQDATWQGYYGSWKASKAAWWPFVYGGAQFLQGVGLSPGFAITLMAVLVVSFAATTLDTAARIQRFIVGELGQALAIKPLRNRYVATIVALGVPLLLVFGHQAMALWPVFGASNQMLAALTLMVLALYFWHRRRPVVALVIPMLLVMAITITALVLKIGEFAREGDWTLAGISAVLLAMMSWMVLEGVALFLRLRRDSRA